MSIFLTAILPLIGVILPILLKWFFSGSAITKVYSTGGLPNMSLPAVKERVNTKLNLPVLSLPFLLLACAGCFNAQPVGGTAVTHKLVFVEPGAPVRVAEEIAVDVTVKLPDGTDAIQKKNIGGKVLMDIDIYRKLRETYVKVNGEE